MKIAQILYNKIHWLPDTTETLEQFCSKFAPDMVFVEVADSAAEGWEWDGRQAVEPVEPQTMLDELKATRW